YFPPADRHGMPSFLRVLRAVSDAYARRPDTVAASVASMRHIYEASVPDDRARGDINGGIDRDFLAAAVRAVASHYDARSGGFSGAPKFPPTMLLDFLLRHWARTGASNSLEMARATFVKMARGGIYDQIGGGFARYSVDAEWLVPHFEKMLYDNALLIRFGAHLYEATKDEEVRRVTEESVAWLAREMTGPEGEFHSSLVADSDGAEGKFYIWSADELDALLGADAAIVKTYFGVTAMGNFEGRNILHVVKSPSDIADGAGITVAQLLATIARARQTLYDRRSRRVWPGRDDKTIAAWNGLALRGVTEAARALDRNDFRALAARNADFLLEHMVVDGRVMRSYKNGVTRIPGFLEDQAAVALGFLAMFEQSVDAKWLDAARRLAITMLDKFWDGESNVFFDTAGDAEQLVTRPRDPTDNATPSGTSLAVDLLLRLANYDDDQRFRDHAQRIMTSLAGVIARYPSAFGHMLGNAEYAETFACHGEYCDMPSPRALDIARATPTSHN
ncbi:MAG: thioredoxin domain-containing protein, partial [Gemmatimonadales bacterium]